MGFYVKSNWEAGQAFAEEQAASLIRQLRRTRGSAYSEAVKERQRSHEAYGGGTGETYPSLSRYVDFLSKIGRNFPSEDVDLEGFEKEINNDFRHRLLDRPTVLRT
jgi:hypothetical protein